MFNCEWLPSKDFLWVSTINRRINFSSCEFRTKNDRALEIRREERKMKAAYPISHVSVAILFLIRRGPLDSST